MALVRGTGSNTLTCEDVFVPRYRVMSHIAAAEGDYPTEFKYETVYHAAWTSTLTLALVGPLLGIGRSALAHVRSAAKQKGIVATGFQRQADSVGFQIQLAEAALRIAARRGQRRQPGRLGPTLRPSARVVEFERGDNFPAIPVRPSRRAVLNRSH